MSFTEWLIIFAGSLLIYIYWFRIVKDKVETRVFNGKIIYTSIIDENSHMIESFPLYRTQITLDDQTVLKGEKYQNLTTIQRECPLFKMNITTEKEIQITEIFRKIFIDWKLLKVKDFSIKE